MLIEGANNNKFLDKKDLVDGEFMQIADAGWVEQSQKYTNKDGTPKARRMFNIMRKGELNTAEFNWTSIKELCKVYGSDTSDWVGKWVKLSKNYDIAKKQENLYYLPVEASKNKELTEAMEKKGIKVGAAQAAPLTPSDIAWEE